MKREKTESSRYRNISGEMYVHARPCPSTYADMCQFQFPRLTGVTIHASSVVLLEFTSTMAMENRNLHCIVHRWGIVGFFSVFKDVRMWYLMSVYNVGNWKMVTAK